MKAELDIIKDFSDIQRQYKVEDESFQNGIKFALGISEGRNRAEVYKEVFGETQRLSYTATVYMRKKWVGTLIDRMLAGNHILHSYEHHMALKELYDIGMNGEYEKNRVDALKSFIEVTKMPVKEEIDYKDMAGGIAMLGKMKNMLEELAEKQVVVKGGELIDVKVLES